MSRIFSRPAMAVAARLRGFPTLGAILSIDVLTPEGFGSTQHNRP